MPEISRTKKILAAGVVAATATTFAILDTLNSPEPTPAVKPHSDVFPAIGGTGLQNTVAVEGVTTTSTLVNAGQPNPNTGNISPFTTFTIDPSPITTTPKA
ncbi:MAG: hypothetical protein V4702_00980 [Patescibacteria group bacterium]